MNGTVRDEGRWPDFLVIGAPKAGSTSLFAALARHPAIFPSPVKEPRYFCLAGKQPVFHGPGARKTIAGIVWDERRYLQLFADCPPGCVTGEASVDYLYDSKAPGDVRARVPEARLVAVLRHPVDRAYSQFLHLRHRGYEPLESFEDAWNAGPERFRNGWQAAWLLRERGFYAEQLERWLAHFPRDQLLVLFYEDWVERPAEVLERICGHLGIDALQRPRVTRENVSSRRPYWNWLHHRMTEQNALREWAQRRLPLWMRDAITRPLARINTSPGPTLDPDLRNRLTRTYLDDIDKLEAMTGRDLGHWRSQPAQ